MRSCFIHSSKKMQSGIDLSLARQIIVLLLFFFASGAFADTASQIYWTEWRSYNPSGSRIVRANADGSDAVAILDGFYNSVGVKDLAIDMVGQKLFFANRSADIIEQCNFDGTARDTIVSGVYPVGLAVDPVGAKIYWADYTYSNPRIRRADLDGENIQDLVSASSGCVLEGIVLDTAAGYIYWAERMDQQIWRAHMAGGGATMILQCWEGVGHPSGLGIAGGRLYWGGDNAISSCNMTGDDVQSVVIGLPDSPRSMEIDIEAGQIYWTTGSLSSGLLQRINLDGSGLTTLVTGLRASYGIALEFGAAVHAPDLPISRLNLNNYPNPFNPKTTISFTVPKAGGTTLQVLGLDGSLVRTLCDGWRDAGPHTVMWNGCNSQGQAMSSGVYLVRLVSTEGKTTQSVTLVR